MSERSALESRIIHELSPSESVDSMLRKLPLDVLRTIETALRYQ